MEWIPIKKNAKDNISQAGVIYTVIWYQDVLYYKIPKSDRSLRNYLVDVYRQSLKRVSFANYENFDDPDLAYRDFNNRLDCCR